MLQSPNPTSCSFCGTSWSETNRLVSGPGVAVCRSCASGALELFEGEEDERLVVESPKELADEQVLLHLPEVAAVAFQVDAQLRAWVDVARSRGISWARIGTALEITRQTAWERFARR